VPPANVSQSSTASRLATSPDVLAPLPLGSQQGASHLSAVPESVGPDTQQDALLENAASEAAAAASPAPAGRFDHAAVADAVADAVASRVATAAGAAATSARAVSAAATVRTLANTMFPADVVANVVAAAPFDLTRESGTDVEQAPDQQVRGFRSRPLPCGARFEECFEYALGQGGKQGDSASRRNAVILATIVPLEIIKPARAAAWDVFGSAFAHESKFGGPMVTKEYVAGLATLRVGRLALQSLRERSAANASRIPLLDARGRSVGWRMDNDVSALKVALSPVQEVRSTFADALEYEGILPRRLDACAIALGRSMARESDIYKETCRGLFGREWGAFTQQGNTWEPQAVVAVYPSALARAPEGTTAASFEEALSSVAVAGQAPVLCAYDKRDDTSLRLEPAANAHELLSLILYVTGWVQLTTCAVGSREVAALKAFLGDMQDPDGVTADTVRKRLLFECTNIEPLTNVAAVIVWAGLQWRRHGKDPRIARDGDGGAGEPRGDGGPAPAPAAAAAAAAAAEADEDAENAGPNRGSGAQPAVKKPRTEPRVPRGGGRSVLETWLGPLQHARFMHGAVKAAVLSWPKEVRFRVHVAAREGDAQAAAPARRQRRAASSETDNRPLADVLLEDLGLNDDDVDGVGGVAAV